MTSTSSSRRPGLLIRDTNVADLRSITEIYAHHVHNGLASFEEQAPDVDEIERRHHAVRDAGLPYLTATIDNAVVGYAYVTGYRTRPAYRYALENSVYVAAGYARQGIGGALLGSLIRHCESGPWRQIIAIIGDTKNVASIRLHERHGFVHAGTLKSVGFKHGRWVDTVLLQRHLGAGDTAPPETATSR